MFWAVPDEGNLVLVHPRLQFQTGIFSKWWNDKTEDEGNADKDSRKDDLHTHSFKISVHLINLISTSLIPVTCSCGSVQVQLNQYRNQSTEGLRRSAGTLIMNLSDLRSV